MRRPRVSGPSAHRGRPGCKAFLRRTLRCVCGRRKLSTGPTPQRHPRPGGAHRSGVGAHGRAVALRWRRPAVCIGQHLPCGLTGIRSGHLGHKSVRPATPALQTRGVPQARAGSPPARSLRRGRGLCSRTLLHRRPQREPGGTSYQTAEPPASGRLGTARVSQGFTLIPAPRTYVVRAAGVSTHVHSSPHRRCTVSCNLFFTFIPSNIKTMIL